MDKVGFGVKRVYLKLPHSTSAGSLVRTMDELNSVNANTSLKVGTMDLYSAMRVGLENRIQRPNAVFTVQKDSLLDTVVGVIARHIFKVSDHHLEKTPIGKDGRKGVHLGRKKLSS